MCIGFDGHHFDGSSFVYVNDFCYYRNCLYTHRYKFSSEKKKEKSKESQYMVSHPKTGSNPQIESDREPRHDTYIFLVGNFCFILEFFLDFWKDNLVMSAVESLIPYQRPIHPYFWRDNVTDLMIKFGFPYQGPIHPYLGL